MTKDILNTRSFKGGAWDLRKDDRRKEQATIAFPERRKNSRRSSLEEVGSTSSIGLLNWVSRLDVDE
jgi:hypothetical protein